MHISDKILNLKTIFKIHIKCDVIASSIVDGLREPMLFSFLLERPSGYKLLGELETLRYKKINKSVLKTITFNLEEDNHKEVNFCRKF